MPLILLAYLAFISISLPDGLTGVAWPAMRLSFDQPVSALSVVMPFAVASSMLSSASTGFVLGRLGVGRLLAVSTAVSAVALTAQAAAPAFWILIAAVALASAGSGAIDAGLNAHAARHFNARQINWMHACYGLGAALGPLLVAATAGLGLSWRWAYGCVAAVQAVLGGAFAATVRAWAAAPARQRSPHGGAPDAVSSGALWSGAVWSGAAVFVLQTGLESSTALWAFVYLTEARGIRFGGAAAAVSGYWLALLVGRLVLGPAADRVGARRVLAGCLAGMVAGAFLVSLPGNAAVSGVLVLGLAAAPMFPLLTLTTSERVGERRAARAIGVQVAASTAGAATMPAVAGLLIGRFGAGVLAPCLVVLAAATAVAYAVAAHRPAGTRTGA